MRVHIKVLMAAVLAMVGGIVAPAKSAHSSTAQRIIDFNGDGRADLVASSTLGAASSVSRYETYVRDGASGTWSKVLTPDAVVSLAACDFNADGFTDLALGQTWLDRAGGGVQISYGSLTGLGSLSTFTQNTNGVPGASEEGDAFGEAMACGFVGSDKYADLLVGAPGEALGAGGSRTGAVTMLRGGASGISAAGSALISQDTPGVYGAAETGDAFGSAIAVGDVTGDGLSEILISARWENDTRGMIHSLRGTTSGWTGTGSTYAMGLTADEGFGKEIALGRFDGTGPLDVAVATEPTSTRGAVAIFKASSSNISSARTQLSQNSSGVPDSGEFGDQWAFSIAAGDINGDGRDDLIVGNPSESQGGVDATGAITVLRGSSTGLTGTGAVAYNQNSTGVPNSNENYDYFGAQVALSDVNGDGYQDPVIASWFENNQGVLAVLKGSAAGLAATGALAFGKSDVGASDPQVEALGLRLAR